MSDWIKNNPAQVYIVIPLAVVLVGLFVYVVYRGYVGPCWFHTGICS